MRVRREKEGKGDLPYDVGDLEMTCPDNMQTLYQRYTNVCGTVEITFACNVVST